jgi:outer membrane protein assembly factor BamB
MTRIALILLFTTLVSGSRAQLMQRSCTFLASPQWEQLQKLCRTPNGDLVALGNRSEQLLAVRMDPQGQVIWTRELGMAGNELPGDVVARPSGGVFIYGSTAAIGTNNFDHFVCALDDNGGIEWTQKLVVIDADMPGSIAVTADGGCVIVGKYGIGMALTRLNADGALIWSERLFWTDAIDGSDVFVHPDGALSIAGFMAGIGLMIVRTDPNGEPLWARTYDIPSNGGGFMPTSCCGFRFAHGMVDGLIVCGTMDGDTVDGVLVSLTDGGDLVWAKAVHGLFMVELHGATVAEDGTVTAVGLSREEDNLLARALIVSFDPTGEPIRSMVVGDPLRSPNLWDVMNVGSGIVAVGGVQPSASGSDNDAWIARMDDQGPPCEACGASVGASFEYPTIGSVSDQVLEVEGTGSSMPITFTSETNVTITALCLPQTIQQSQEEPGPGFVWDAPQESILVNDESGRSFHWQIVDAMGRPIRSGHHRAELGSIPCVGIPPGAYSLLHFNQQGRSGSWRFLR